MMSIKNLVFDFHNISPYTYTGTFLITSVEEMLQKWGLGIRTICSVSCISAVPFVDLPSETSRVDRVRLRDMCSDILPQGLEIAIMWSRNVFADIMCCTLQFTADACKRKTVFLFFHFYHFIRHGHISLLGQLFTTFFLTPKCSTENINAHGGEPSIL